VLGLLALSEGRLAEAVETLAPLEAIAERVGATDPNTWLLFLPDLIEALVGAGRIDEAEQRTAILEARSDRTGLPRGLSVAARCRALVLLARNEADAAIATAGVAASVPEVEQQPFEVARAVDVRGRAEAGAGRFEAANSTLAVAAQRYDGLGARRWAARARAARQENA
jgi:hypothetical protein